MSDIQPLHEQVYQRRQILDRLQTAAARLAEAQLERTWAIVSAHEQGLSVRQIATATGLSPTRVHQLLGAPDAQQIPRWLSQLREHEESAAASTEITRLPGACSNVAWLDAEVKALRQCIGWLKQLEHGEPVVVNLHLETDPVTDFVRFDAERVRRVLGRIAADLETVALSSSVTADGAGESEEAGARHRRRLAEPPAQSQRLSPREERNALRAQLGLPPQ